MKEKICLEKTTDPQWIGMPRACIGFLGDSRVTLVAYCVVAMMGFACTKDVASGANQRIQSKLEKVPCNQHESPSMQLERSVAYSMARTYAYEQGLLSLPIEIEVLDNPNGGWLVLFSHGSQTQPDGSQNNLLSSWSCIVRVKTDGSCSADGRYAEAGEDASPWVGVQTVSSLTSPESVENILDERLVISLAKTFAIRHGIIPTETVVTDCQAKDGSWIFSFSPGRFISRNLQDSDKESEADSPFFVFVSSSGSCRAFPERNSGTE